MSRRTGKITMNRLAWFVAIVALGTACATKPTLPTPPASPINPGLVNLGMVSFRTNSGRYLQAHSDNGEMHASNEKRNEEETWFLVQVDAVKHIYAIYNWSSGKFISKNTASGCAPADVTSISKTEEWVLVSGVPFGILNAVALKSLADGTYIGANPPAHDDKCGGEVAARSTQSPLVRPTWPGWWTLAPATEPSPGKDAWNTAGNFLLGIANKISPADIAKVFAGSPAPTPSP